MLFKWWSVSWLIVRAWLWQIQRCFWPTSTERYLLRKPCINGKHWFCPSEAEGQTVSCDTIPREIGTKIYLLWTGELTTDWTGELTTDHSRGIYHLCPGWGTKEFGGCLQKYGLGVTYRGISDSKETSHKAHFSMGDGSGKLKPWLECCI